MCTQGLATGKDVQTDCSINATIKGKTYCFGTLAGALVLGLATAQPNVLAGGLHESDFRGCAYAHSVLAFDEMAKAAFASGLRKRLVCNSPALSSF